MLDYDLVRLFEIKEFNPVIIKGDFNTLTRGLRLKDIPDGVLILLLLDWLKVFKEVRRFKEQIVFDWTSSEIYSHRDVFILRTFIKHNEGIHNRLLENYVDYKICYNESTKRDVL